VDVLAEATSLTPEANTRPAMLRGYRVGITADRRWEEQASLFERRGATVVHGPAMRTLRLGSDSPLKAATEQVIEHPPDILIANTGLGIRTWLNAADGWGLGANLRCALQHTRVYARGPKASAAARAAGFDVAGRPASERLADTVQMALEALQPGQRAALQVDGSGESAELDRLHAAGVDVVVVPVYVWKLPEDRRPAVRLAEDVVAERVHAVTFTAGPAVRNWFAIAAEEGIDAQLRRSFATGRTVIGCVGPVCAEAAVQVGVPSGRIVQPDAWRLAPLVRVVANALTARPTVTSG
jgi:uroporphyrinogen-III synthase